MKIIIIAMLLLMKLLPIILFAFTLFGFLQAFLLIIDAVIERAKVNMGVRNLIASSFYLMMEMGPSIAAVSVVAIVVNSDASVVELVILFIMGFVVKELARTAKNAFFYKLSITEEEGEFTAKNVLYEKAMQTIRKDSK